MNITMNITEQLEEINNNINKYNNNISKLKYRSRVLRHQLAEYMNDSDITDVINKKIQELFKKISDLKEIRNKLVENNLINKFLADY